LDEQLVIRIPGTLKAKLLEKSNQENITLAGTARDLIETGLASGPKIEELKRQYDHLLEAFISTNRANRMTCLTLVETCIAILEKTVDEEQSKSLIENFRGYAEILADNDVFNKDFDRERHNTMIEQFEKKLMKA
jgi:hypothetical protein